MRYSADGSSAARSMSGVLGLLWRVGRGAKFRLDGNGVCLLNIMIREMRGIASGAKVRIASVTGGGS